MIPAPLSGSVFSLDDLKNEADTIEKVKQVWNTKLTEMKTAYSEVKAYEGRDINPNLKATAWNRFIDSFKEDNPYSQEDDSMRQEARKQSDYWSKQPSETKPSVTAGSSTIIGKDGAKMILIHAGDFQMGGNDHDDEKPIHETVANRN